MRGRREERGQATVEFAIVLPAILVVLLLIFQAMVVGHDYLLVMNAAREAARAAAVDPTDRDAVDAVLRTLPDAQLIVNRGGGIGTPVEATVRWQAPTSLPLIGALLPDPWLEATITMRAER